MKSMAKVTHTQSYCQKAHSSIRIISLSDIHFNEHMKVNKVKKVLKLVSSLTPNYIFWLGDNLDTTSVLNNPSKKEEFMELCTESGSIAPTMISLADHDMRYMEGKKFVEDIQSEFWSTVNTIENVHVLDNQAYEDDSLYVVGYTLPTYYYHGSYPLPTTTSTVVREDEEISVLLDNMRENEFLFHGKEEKVNELLFHSPMRLDNDEVGEYLKDFQHVYSGHMHEGLAFPLLDELLPSTLGLISPQRTLFPKNARGVIKTKHGTLCVINGGITKIAEEHRKLKYLNALFPLHIDVIDIQPSKDESYKRKTYYKRLK